MKDQDINYHAYIKSPAWYARRRKAFRLWKGRCALFPWLKARDGHHLTYANLGHEWPLRDVLPLSRFAHRVVHCRLFWARGKPHSHRRVFWGLVWRCWAMIAWVVVRFLEAK